MRSRWTVPALSLLIALLTLIPYGVAYAGAGNLRFTGFLLNPFDAASYLAKMRQGYEGQLIYTLAFAADPGPGAAIFLYYLLLGRIARLLQLSLAAVWQAARVLGAAGFLWIAWEFFGRIGLAVRARRIAWLLVVAGSGFGFLAVLFGGYTADLWVAEYIPFPGMFTSAHFPLATGLILLLAMRIALPPRPASAGSLALTFGIGTLLGAIQPFAFLPLGTALAAWIAWSRIRDGRFPAGAPAGLAAAGAGLLPWVVYDFWITQTMPAFASWFAQNQTPTPPVWDVALSTGLPGLLCLALLIRWVRAAGGLKEKLPSVPDGALLAALWLALNLVLIYLPVPLQRRLMLGMWIPLAALAAPALEAWLFRPALDKGRAWAAGVPLVLSNLFFAGLLLAVGLSRNPNFFLTPGQAAAADWLAENAHGQVVLAPRDLARWLPGLSGVRVVFGHPMETPDAEAARAAVDCVYRSGTACDPPAVVETYRVGWIVADSDWTGAGMRLVEAARFGDITIWAVEG
jgi:hypothetical protein